MAAVVVVVGSNSSSYFCFNSASIVIIYLVDVSYADVIVIGKVVYLLLC